MGTLKGGYIIPDEPLPEADYCLRVYVPANTEYLIQFMTALAYFGKWNSWKRRHDGTNIEKEVADRWKVAIEKTHQAWSEGGCGVPQFRINDECLLEVKCGDDWQPVFTQSNPTGVPETPYPSGTPEYTSDTARCIAAANITSQLKSGTETLANDAAIVGGIAIAIINLLAAFLFFVPGGVLVDIAIAIVDLAVGHVASDFSDDLPAIDWDSVRDELACLLERDGTLTSAGRSAFLTWMEGQYPGNLAWALSKIIIEHVDAGGLTLDARIPQNDIAVDECAACSSPSCLWNFESDSMPYYLDSGVISTDASETPGGHGVKGLIEVSTQWGAPHYQNIIQFRAVVTTAGTLTRVAFDHKFANSINYNTPAVGVTRGGTSLYYNIVGESGPVGDWHTNDRTLSIAVLPGDIVAIYTGYNNYDDAVQAAGSVLYLDNVLLEPCEIFS